MPFLTQTINNGIIYPPQVTAINSLTIELFTTSIVKLAPNKTWSYTATTLTACYRLTNERYMLCRARDHGRDVVSVLNVSTFFERLGLVSVL